MKKELKNENGKLSRKIKNLEFGKFLFLYFVARSTPWRVSNDIMVALKGSEGKGEKALLGAPPRDDEINSQTSLPPYSPRKSANKNAEERIDMPDLALEKRLDRLKDHAESKDDDVKKSRGKSMRSRRIRSRSNSPTPGEQYLSACLNDN